MGRGAKKEMGRKGTGYEKGTGDEKRDGMGTEDMGRGSGKEKKPLKK